MIIEPKSGAINIFTRILMDNHLTMNSKRNKKGQKGAWLLTLLHQQNRGLKNLLKGFRVLISKLSRLASPLLFKKQL